MVAMACHRNTGWSAVTIRVAFLADHLVALAETEASLVGAALLVLPSVWRALCSSATAQASRRTAITISCTGKFTG